MGFHYISTIHQAKVDCQLAFLFLLQEKIDRLLDSVRMLLPDGSNIGFVYSDDLANLNKSIHDQMDELYIRRGETVEQEATLCLAVLMGYNVSMYANSDDEKKKQFMLERSKYILSQLPHSQLRTRLLYCCLRFVNQK